MGNTYSAIGLCLSSVPIFVHGTECLFPLQCRFIANILPLFSFQQAEGKWLTLKDTESMVQKAIESAPVEARRAAEDFMFIRTFEQRQGSCGFLACAAGALYGATIPLSERHPLHMVNMVMAVLMFIGNFHHATGLPLGYNPFVTAGGKGLGVVFLPFWAVTFFCNYMAFVDSK